MAALIKKPLVIVGLGTSLMSGPLCTPDNPWPEELRKQLSTHPSAKGNVVFVNLGKGSQTTDYFVTQIPNVVGLKPDLFLCETGAVNDCAIGPVSLGQAAANLNAIIDAVQAESPNTHSALMTMSKEALADANRTQQGVYEQQGRDIAAAQGIGLIDNRPNWPNMDANVTWNGDLLHPRWRAADGGPAFDTWSFLTIKAYCVAFMETFWA